MGCQLVFPGTLIYAPVDRNIYGWVGIVICGKKLWFEENRFVDVTPLQALQQITMTYTRPDAKSQPYPCNIAFGMVVFIIGKHVDARGITWVKLQGNDTWVREEVVG
jgi:hypothetical protein